MKNPRGGIKKAFAALLVVLFCVQLAACAAPKSYQTEDPDLYLQTQGHIANEGTDIRSGLFVFPDSLEGLENVEYRYLCKEGLLDNAYGIYLKASYSEDAYQAETERLANIRCEVQLSTKSVENAITHTELLFHYPAYIAVYNTNMSFEYALADEENRCIIYVYLKLLEGGDFLPEAYLPLEFAGKSMLNYDTSWQNPNIYYATDTSGDHVYYLD